MYQPHNLRKSAAGFTLAEALVVIVIAGVLSAIAAPSWLAFLSRQRVIAAQDQALQAMRQAQAKAMRENRVWEVSFQQETEEDPVQWSVHPLDSTEPIWQNLTENPDRIKIENSTLTNGCKFGQSCIQFADRGTLEGDFEYQDNAENPIGQITLTTSDSDNGPKRCVIVATLLGSLRTDKDDNCS